MKQIVVRINYSELTDIPVSPYKAAPQLLVDCYVRQKLIDAGIPITTLSGNVYDGVLTRYEDADNQQRVFVWMKAIVAPKHVLHYKTTM